MSTVYLREPVSEQQLHTLRNEFPRCRFLTELEQSNWTNIEILFGEKLSEEEISQASQLRWIHSPTPDLSSAHIENSPQARDLLATNTKGENLLQTGEFIFSAILAFAKRLFHYERVLRSKQLPWNHLPTLDPIELHEKTLLQVGLGIVGGEVARRGQQYQMRVWGVRRNPSFHPHCTRVYPLGDLPTLVRAADVVCLSLPRGRSYTPWLGKEELSCLKEGAILVVMGAQGTVDLRALEKVVVSTQLRGVLLDNVPLGALAKSSPLLNTPDVILTPGVASHPRREKNLAFRTFRYNLRQFRHGNYLEMRNRIRLDDDL